MGIFAARGDHAEVEYLLYAGADPNLIDQVRMMYMVECLLLQH